MGAQKTTEGNYLLKDNIIKAVNSNNENLTYSILSITDTDLTMEVPIIFFGQQTTVKIECNKLQNN